ncbi:uncharacterized protein LACBIDRAFT_314398 [Laccaria bicolor S238N-H82]|uniref:Predicted protein n=1 Tax=Laccaria bicolor (strain S238N-H82 / ATCC MYA-4686) TaxID=486041 RepID=B0DYH1_LACBS|nr:uncharacterized protein LACBIDRAFT_314398 [Laccaria bicolor S238N-H82]EDR00384.1 predicted protein [Laccaria bicolor S238N-H82]|eukprot:XP_001888943.1 predicted protein [Laccaria bicolor S238N-H82]
MKMLRLTADKPLNPPPIHAFLPTPKLRRFILLGSGHRHFFFPLLTHHILTIHADVVLADKLVPQGMLNLILSKIELIAAKKFPGNK